MLLLIIVLILLFGGGGGYYGYSKWGTGGGLGIVGTVLLIVLILYLLGAIHSIPSNLIKAGALLLTAGYMQETRVHL